MLQANKMGKRSNCSEQNARIVVQDMRDFMATYNINQSELSKMMNYHSTQVNKVIHYKAPVTEKFARKFYSTVESYTGQPKAVVPVVKTEEVSVEPVQEETKDVKNILVDIIKIYANGNTPMLVIDGSKFDMSKIVELVQNGTVVDVL